MLRLVVLNPRRKLDFSSLHGFMSDGIALEQVGDDSQVAIVGELIGEKLAVVVDTEDIGEEDNGLLRGLVVLGVDDVGVD